MLYTKSDYTNFKILFCFADLNPCLDVHCLSFGVCKTFSAHEARCVCYEDCPSYHDPVCTANGTTYDNKCWHELYYCRGLENNLVYHPGSCEGKQSCFCVKLNNVCVCSNLILQEADTRRICSSACGSGFFSLKLIGQLYLKGNLNIYIILSERKILKVICITQNDTRTAVKY